MIAFYLDEHIPRRVQQELEKRGVKALLAVDAGNEGLSDDDHLAFASAQSMVIVTRDMPFAVRTAQMLEHAGLICWTGSDTYIGGMVAVLSEFAISHTPEQSRGRVYWLKTRGS